ncbi:MAG: 3-dehydroquinate synthase [Candidatus Delongbacteria bacterium]|nr:3-dehydroquinate synthase [Candidatus Delongbacteria bacterium]
MKTIALNTDFSSSTIYIGQKFEDFTDHVDPSRVVVVTDENVYKIYENKFKDLRTIVIGTGEGIKSIRTVEYIIKKLIEFNADRNTFLLGAGGGVVTDITGFAASIFLRGIDFGFVSTTLLSQVDAGVGGKNGVNFAGLKNIVGLFNQPQFVICDISMLKTLPEREIRSGIGEIIKHGIIGDPSILDILENEYEKINKTDLMVLENLIGKSVSVKVKIVTEDEHESGVRKVLNFGHTVGHAIELSCDITHGEAISIGMLISLGISVKKSYIELNLFKKIEELIKKYELPTVSPLDIVNVIDLIKYDKKSEQDHLNYILMKGIGNPVIEKIGISKLKNMILS